MLVQCRDINGMHEESVCLMTKGNKDDDDPSYDEHVEMLQKYDDAMHKHKLKFKALEDIIFMFLLLLCLEN